MIRAKQLTGTYDQATCWNMHKCMYVWVWPDIVIYILNVYIYIYIYIYTLYIYSKSATQKYQKSQDATLRIQAHRQLCHQDRNASAQLR